LAPKSGWILVLQANATILRLPRLGIAVLISTKWSWPIEKSALDWRWGERERERGET